jgi:hypothetical protein
VQWGKTNKSDTRRGTSSLPSFSIRCIGL